MRLRSADGRYVLTLASSLTAHQQSPRRRPSVLATVTPARFGVPLFIFQPQTYTNGVDCPIAGVADASGAAVLARNNAGALETMDAAPGGTWTNRDTVTAGQGLALAYDPVADAILLLYGDGNDLKLRSSTDHGATWSGSTTLVTEASAIGSVALAIRASNGNACAFYTLGTTTTLKRLRRTAGTWAGSGTNWTRSGSVATLTGLAAVHSGDFYLAVTGTEVTTTHPRLWSVAMGDTILPSNAWSTLNAIEEADAASGTTFGHPHAALISSLMFVTFQQTEAGNVPGSRVFVTSPPESAGPLAFWRTPEPLPAGTSTFGAAIFDNTAAARSTFATPDAYYHAAHPAALDLSDQLVALSWRLSPASLKVRAELAYAETSSMPFADAVRPGHDLTIQHGYLSGTAGAAEYGQLLRCSVSRVSQAFEPGKLRLIVEADGPWEALARWKAAAAWTAPASTTRASVFSRVAARAGFALTAAGGARAPSAAWTTDTPAFAIAAGETGRSALERLLAPSVDFVRLDFNTGGLQICSFANSDLASADYTYALTTPPSDHPLLSLARFEAHEISRVRVQGPDRYADAFASAAGDDFWNPADELAFELVRDLAATNNTKATDAAARALRRARALTPLGELTAPASVGQELFDVVLASLSPTSDVDVNITARVIGIGLDYRRGPAPGAPAYTTTLTLGRG